MSKEHIALVERYIAAMNAHDYDTVVSLLTPDHVFHGVLSDEHGAESFRQVIARYHSVFPDQRMTVEHIFAGDEFVGARVRHQGTHEGEGWPIPPTGRRAEFPVHLHVRVEDGKLAEVWEQWDRAAVREQLTATD